MDEDMAFMLMSFVLEEDFSFVYVISLLFFGLLFFGLLFFGLLFFGFKISNVVI